MKIVRKYTVLADLRKDYRYSQQFVADYLGITQPAYSRLECGEIALRVSTLIELAEFYAVTTESILYSLIEQREYCFENTVGAEFNEDKQSAGAT